MHMGTGDSDFRLLFLRFVYLPVEVYSMDEEWSEIAIQNAFSSRSMCLSIFIASFLIVRFVTRGIVGVASKGHDEAVLSLLIHT
jgi:hypothetical protein